MPSIRIRQDSYASPQESPESGPLSPRSLANSLTGTTTPTGFAPLLRPRPSLPVLSGAETVSNFRPRSNTGSLSRVQSRILRGSLRGFGILTHHGPISYRGLESFGSPEFSDRLLVLHNHNEGSSLRCYERTTSPDAAAEGGWTEIHHDDIVEHLDVIGTLSCRDL